MFFFFFVFNDTATTEIYTLSLHDALPISGQGFKADRYKLERCRRFGLAGDKQEENEEEKRADRKSTRLNSSHW